MKLGSYVLDQATLVQKQKTADLVELNREGTKNDSERRFKNITGNEGRKEKVFSVEEVSGGI